MATSIKNGNACMEAAKKQADFYRKYYGPSNSELLKEITELKKEVAELKQMIKCLNNQP